MLIFENRYALTAMQITAFAPAEPLVRSIIEGYQCYVSQGSEVIKTVPNGRVTAWITLEGAFHMLLPPPGPFLQMPESGFFPITTAAGTLKLDPSLRVIAITFFPHVLGLPALRRLSGCNVIPFSALFAEADLFRLKTELSRARTVEAYTGLLDRFFLDTCFTRSLPDPWLGKVVGLLEAGAPVRTSMKDIASQACVSQKTLDRKFKQYTGLSPKLFASVLRFHQTLENIRAGTGGQPAYGDLSPLLGVGYYDQSHFIKACRKITGLSPKDLFASLPAATGAAAGVPA